MVRFMYGGCLDNDSDYNSDLFKIAHKYSLLVLQQLCEQEMVKVKRIDDTNVVEMWADSDLYEAKVWKRAVVNHLVSNWSKKDNFVGLEEVLAKRPQLVKDLLPALGFKGIGKKIMELVFDNADKGLIKEIWSSL